MATESFDVFLCYHKDDSPSVEALALHLRQRGVQPWLDEWHIVPGTPWIPEVERALDSCATCAVCMGPSGISPWQHEHMRVAIGLRVQRTASRYRVIPVVLPGGRRGERGGMPLFMSGITWVEFRTSLDDERALHRLISGIRGIEPEIGSTPDEDTLPYQGLRPFDVTHAPFFFGREALVEWLLDDIGSTLGARPACRFLAIVGASGSGKSSLARAGLLAALQQDRLLGSKEWSYAVLTPGANPLSNLAQALAATLHNPGAALNVAKAIDLLARDERSLDILIRQGMQDSLPDQHLVVLIDQFEELFTQCTDLEQRRQFIAGLVYASGSVLGRTLVVIVLRADFYSRCAAYPELAALLSNRQVLVGPLSRIELRRAIERPAFVARYEFEDELVEQILEDAGDQAELPLIQFALLRLWERRDQQRRLLTKAAYVAIGGVQGALESHTESIYESLSGDQQKVCRQVLLDLIQPGEAEDDTRRPVALAALAPAVGDRDRVTQIVERLAAPDARLLVIDRDAQGGQPQVQIAHETLIQSWGQLRGWVEQERAQLLLRRELSRAARRWARAERNKAYLLTDRPLAELASLRGRSDLGEPDSTFLKQSIAAARAQQVRRVVGRIALITLAMLLLGTGWWVSQVLLSPWQLPAGAIAIADPVNDLRVSSGPSPTFYVATKDLGVGYSSDARVWKFTPANELGLPTGPPADKDPHKIVGTVPLLAIDPIVPQRLLAGVKFHNIYSSDNGAVFWHESDHGIDETAVAGIPLTALGLRGDLALAVFQAPTFGNSSGLPGKLYISRNSGADWRDETLPGAGVIYTAVIAPDGTLIYVGTEHGLFRGLPPVEPQAKLRWEQIPDLPPAIRIAFGANDLLYLATDQQATGRLDVVCWRVGAQPRMMGTTRDQARELAPRPEALYILQQNGAVLKMDLAADGCGSGTVEELYRQPGYVYTLLAVPSANGGTQLLIGDERGVLEYRKPLGRASP